LIAFPNKMYYIVQIKGQNKMLSKFQRLATAKTKEELLEAIEEYFYGEKMKLKDHGEILRVSDNKLMENYSYKETENGYMFFSKGEMK